MTRASLAAVRGAMLATICPLALVAAGPAAAQSAEQTNVEAQASAPGPEATAAADAEGEDTATGEIVVTARRTEEKLQRVPGSISAFNERALDRLQATDPVGLQGAVPNLNIVQGRGSSNATNIFIRGIGQPDALQTFDPAVGVYIDDVYLSRIRGAQLDLLDIERVEVLRGPQGTLYGKNTIGGALKFVTRRPGDSMRGTGSISVGSYNQVDAKLSVSGPLTEGVGLGLSLLRSARDGYVEDRVTTREYNDKDTFALRGNLAFTPSSRLRVDFVGDYSQDDAALNVGRPVNDLVSALGFALPVSNEVGTGDYDWTGRATPSLPNSTKLKHRGISATVAYDLTEALSLRSITAARALNTDDYVDIDASEWQLGDVFVGVNQRQVSQELQLALRGPRLSGVAGLYFLREHVTSHQEAYGLDLYRSALGPLFSSVLRTIDDDLTTKSYAAYINGSFEIFPTVRLSAGLRYTRESKVYDRTTSVFLSGALAALPFAFNASDKWTDTSPMASIDWQVTPETMLYARVAKGFKSGGFNGRANSPGEATQYEPETVWSYEGEFKTSIASQLRLNGAIFHNDYRDFQARVSEVDEDPILGVPGARLSVLNAGKLQIRGAELEAAWTPIVDLLIDSQIGYLDADYKEFIDLRFPGGSRAFQTPAFSPRWTVRVGAQYSMPVGAGGGITIGGQSRFRSRTALAVDNTVITAANVGTTTVVEGLFQDPFWVHDARIVWENASRKLAIGVYGNNLTNKAYKTDGQDFSTIGGVRTVYYGAPRTIALRLTARY